MPQVPKAENSAFEAVGAAVWRVRTMIMIPPGLPDPWKCLDKDALEVLPNLPDGFLEALGLDGAKSRGPRDSVG